MAVHGAKLNIPRHLPRVFARRLGWPRAAQDGAPSGRGCRLSIANASEAPEMPIEPRHHRRLPAGRTTLFFGLQPGPAVSTSIDASLAAGIALLLLCSLWCVCRCVLRAACSVLDTLSPLPPPCRPSVRWVLCKHLLLPGNGRLRPRPPRRKIRTRIFSIPCRWPTSTVTPGSSGGHRRRRRARRRRPSVEERRRQTRRRTR